MKIRTASMDDVALLQELCSVLDEDAASSQPEHFVRALRPDKLIRGHLSDENSIVLIIESESASVGFVHAQLQEPLDNGVYKKHRFLCVWDIVVRKEFRGTGVGSALLLAAKEWGRKNGASYMRLNVLVQNEPAIRFYRKHGFECVQHTMESPI